MDWTVEKRKYRKIGERREKERLKTKVRAGKAETKDGPYSWQQAKSLSRKNEGESGWGAPSWRLRSWRPSPSDGPSSPLLFFTIHHFSCSHTTAPGIMPPHARTWRSENRVPLDHIAPGKPMESIGQGEGTPSPPLISTLPVLWLRNFQESGESPIPWQPRSPPLCFKRGWIPNNRSIQAKICSQDQVL